MNKIGSLRNKSFNVDPNIWGKWQSGIYAEKRDAFGTQLHKCSGIQHKLCIYYLT